MTGFIGKNLRRVRTVVRREVSYRISTPREAGIELTWRCNLRCRMCGVIGKGRNREDTELTVAEYRALFIQMREIGIRLVTFTGGEPFIRKDLFDIVKEAKTQGLRCNIFSNGTLIQGDILERIFDSGIDKLIFSVDGMNGVHDSIRGIPGSFDKVFGTLSTLVAMRRARGARRPEIDAHMTLMRGNVGDLLLLSAHCRALSINFSYQPYSESNAKALQETIAILEGVHANRYLPRDETLRFTDEEMDGLRDQLARLPADFYAKLLSSLDPADLKQGLMPMRKCYFTRNFVMIDPYGTVFPCTNLDSYGMGSIRSHTLSEIWRGAKYKHLRQMLSRRLLPLCAYCCHCADNLSLVQLVRIVAATTVRR
jgi:radical SAM protein with 4Fe4S-binding SPASM domain